jgi:outer membrane biosynthesis protein TonB
MRFALQFGFTLALALATAPAIAGQQKQVPDCCPPNAEKLSPRQVKSMLLKTEPIQPPALGNQVHIESTVVLAIAVDAGGKVACLQYIAGHPLILQSAIDSVRRWRFRPYVLRGRSKRFCGRIALTIKVDEQMVKYDVVEAPPD